MHEFMSSSYHKLTKCLNIFITLMMMTEMIAGAKILGVFTMDGFGHFNVNNVIMEILAKAGHEITIISPFEPEPFHQNTNITYIQMSKPSTKPAFATKYSFSQRSLTWWQFINIMGGFVEEECYRFITLPQIQNILASKEKKFDLMFIDLFTLTECYLPIAKQQKMPVIGIYLSNLRSQPASKVGNPLHPSVTPVTFSSRSPKMTFVERLQNFVDMLHLNTIFDIVMTPRFTKFCAKYFPQHDIRKENQVSLLFQNNHHSLLKIPLDPTVIEIAGIHLKPPKHLPKTLEEFISGAHHGTILFSFGSLADTKSMTTEIFDIFRSTFAALPQRVIWKSSQPIDGISDNVLVSEWIPQQDVLAHKNVILFISHMGKSSEIEAVYTETPVLAIPLFGDQFGNAANIEELGVGKALDIRTLTKSSLQSSIQDIIQDKNYVERMKTLSKRFKDRPMSPQDTVIYWTEYILRHNGASHLRTAGADMPFHQYFLLDVILFIVAMATGMFCTLYVIKRILFCLCTQRK